MQMHTSVHACKAADGGIDTNGADDADADDA